MTVRDISQPIADLNGALRVVEDYCQSPSAALAAANSKKGVANRPFLRPRQEIDAQLADAASDDIEALTCLSRRLDLVNQQLVANLQRVISSDNDTEIRWNSIEKVGIYVPQRLPATAYTFLSAAKAAGVRELVVYTAQDAEGNLDPLVLWCARQYGATIAGGPARFGFPVLAFGLPEESLVGCPLVCGPCGRAMNVIKQVACLVAGVASDMSAGPSDLAILADETADWKQIALDIVSQLEHGPDSSAEIALVGHNATQRFTTEVVADMANNLRVRIKVNECASLDEGIRAINDVAPETAEVWVAADSVAEKLTTSGVVYERKGSSLGDYGAIGRGCADPTGKLARAQSGLSPLTFMRTTAIVRGKATTDANRLFASRLSAYEGLPQHQRAIDGPAGRSRESNADS